MRADFTQAIAELPENLIQAVDNFTKTKKSAAKWTDVCIIKAFYIKGTSLSGNGNVSEALATFQSVIPWITSRPDEVQSNIQLSYWCQQLLAQAARLASKHVDFPNPEPSWLENALLVFRAWALVAVKSKDAGPDLFGNPLAHISRRSLCQTYYRFLSGVLHNHVAYPESDDIDPRLQQSTELRRVEAMYESELLRVTRFPRATENSVEIEKWVETVIQNWHILCGPGWYEDELGDGGRNAVGRNVLDILYRAAMKTFHSTVILRLMFQVHMALTEFDLAYRALATYIELVERQQARADKVNEPLQESPETILRTIAEGVEGLCSFGGKNEAERTLRLTTKLEEWLARVQPEDSEDDIPNGHAGGGVDPPAPAREGLSPETMERVHRAIGIGKAQWARWTPFSENRTSLQTEAIFHLQKAYSQPNDGDRLETTYALGLLLAETREINQAIDYIKKGLSWRPASGGSEGANATERKMIPLWHLLALLLTSRQDFATASPACAAAFEQFPSTEILFGSDQTHLSSEAYGKESSNEMQRGLVDDMECAELQRIIEIRITELALTELMDGPEEAVNRSNELLRLFSRLFGHLGVGLEENTSTKTVELPKSSSATIKSFRGSLFGRKRVDSESLADKRPAIAPLPEDRTSRPVSRWTETPAIHVTDEDGKTPTKRHLFRKSEDRSAIAGHDGHGGHRREGSFSRLMRPHSRSRKEAAEAKANGTPKQSFETPEHPIDLREPEQKPSRNSQTPTEMQTLVDGVPPLPPPLDHESQSEAKQSLPPVPHNVASEKLVLPSGHSEQPPVQDVRLPTSPPGLMSTPPIPRFSKVAAQRHALAILVKIWLLIATLYRRANLFEDSREACDEAAKAAQRVETLVASVESSARAFSDAGWGGIGKSSDEIWADVYCERAELSLTVAKAREEKEEIRDNEKVREGVEQYEQCLMYFPDHPKGIVGLSNMLLDYSERKIELGKKVDDGRPKDEIRTPPQRSAIKVSSNVQNGRPSGTRSDSHVNAPATDDELKKTPDNLNRLAARDRAYGLLSTLTKLGSGWDDSQAWFALARAHELGGEMDKAREILWWCVELEDHRPIRHWRNLGCSGYVL